MAADALTEVRTVEALSFGNSIVFQRRDEKPLDMTVSFIYTDWSKGASSARTVQAHIRPGGYGVSIDDGQLASGLVKVWRRN